MGGGREEIYKRLQEDLFGPLKSDEILSSYPSDVYLTGILFPQNAEVGEEDADQSRGEDSAGDPNDGSEDEISLSNTKRPASIGISFAVDGSTIGIKINAGTYRPVEEAQGQGGAAESPPEDSEAKERDQGPERERGSEDRREEGSRRWQRVPLEVAIGSVPLQPGSQGIDLKDYGVEGLRLYVRCSPWGKYLLTTVAVLNCQRIEKRAGRVEIEEKSFFQVQLTILPAATTRFVPRPLRTSAADEDAASARLIYRDATEYAVGHICAADWRVAGNGSVDLVRTNWLPAVLVPTMSSSGDSVFQGLTTGERNVLSARWLSDSSGPALTDALGTLPETYERWLEAEKDKKRRLPEALAAQADRHLANARFVVTKMRAAVELIASNADVQLAFRLANRAVLVQRTWVEPGSAELVWRPFQLGFLLLSLPSVADSRHADRSTADLLWFPTGGGKTEAYLGLIAFTLFLRRIRHGDDGSGVAAIMRYTLRLVTVQQFQRAAALVCACERMRLGQFLPSDVKLLLGRTPFSIGLWVGQDTVPNDVEKAEEALKAGSSSTPRQLRNCPCEQKRTLFWRREHSPDAIRVSCLGENCVWSMGRKGHLPVWTVDEDIYRERPSLVIGTVDKFAQIVREPRTAALFGAGQNLLPPELIIQDELHLISGPLGTLTGLYEVAIDRLCIGKGGTRPKIIASTATIRQAESQIRMLFDRGTCLFPPPVIDAGNSGFAVEDRSAPGRLYVGVTTAGRSAKFTLQAVTASLVQSAASGAVSEVERDLYWTLVNYFNSLRELGGALVLMQDDVVRSLADYAARRSESPREIRDITELTSRVSSSQIPEILDRLALPFNEPGACDVVLASNMISVGIDIPRLGLMAVNGQPKGIAEYIQSTSRVGRGAVPGLVVSIYNNAKARDRSHFETFRTWHTTLYRDVEATSVTPFSSRARDRALHAVLVAMARHLVPALKLSPRLKEDQVPELEKLASWISARAARLDQQESAALDEELREIITRWLQRAGLKTYWNDRWKNTSLLISAERAAELRAAGRALGSAWPTPNSMRNVEPSTAFVLAERLRDNRGTRGG